MPRVSVPHASVLIAKAFTNVKNSTAQDVHHVILLHSPGPPARTFPTGTLVLLVAGKRRKRQQANRHAQRCVSVAAMFHGQLTTCVPDVLNVTNHGKITNLCAIVCMASVATVVRSSPASGAAGTKQAFIAFIARGMDFRNQIRIIFSDI